MNYQKKYLKYKEKYISLKNQYGGAAKIGDTVYRLVDMYGRDLEVKEKLGTIVGEDEAGIYEHLNYEQPIWFYKSDITKPGISGHLIKSLERLRWEVNNPIDSSSGMATSSPTKIFIPVYKDFNYSIYASNTNEGSFKKYQCVEHFYTISAEDFPQCGKSLGLPSLEFGKRSGSSIMLVYMEDKHSKLDTPQKDQLSIWRQQNTDEGRYDAYFYIQIHNLESDGYKAFQSCIGIFKRKELPNGQIHLY